MVWKYNGLGISYVKPQRAQKFFLCLLVADFRHPSNALQSVIHPIFLKENGEIVKLDPNGTMNVYRGAEDKTYTSYSVG